MFSLEQIQQYVKVSEKAMIYKEPGFIVGPIAFVLGIVINILFNIIYGISPVNSFGFTIIAFTIFIRILMLPLVHKQMDSMRKMQEIVPLTNEIKAKYAGKSDKESKQKETMEIQKLYQENGVNPFGGCLPMLIQMPIFFALNQIIRNGYIYIDKINHVYTNISTQLMSLPNYMDTLTPLILPKLMRGVPLDMATTEGLNKAVNVFSASDWYTILATAPTDQANDIANLLIQKSTIDSFFGMNLSENPALLSISVLIPILCMVTTYLSSYFSMKGTASSDPSQMKQQKIMLIAMPIMMGFMSFSLTAGVGLYWITSSTFQILQQLYINKKRKLLAEQS